jgi:hypothetical protein
MDAAEAKYTVQVRESRERPKASGKDKDRQKHEPIIEVVLPADAVDSWDRFLLHLSRALHKNVKDAYLGKEEDQEQVYSEPSDILQKIRRERHNDLILHYVAFQRDADLRALGPDDQALYQQQFEVSSKGAITFAPSTVRINRYYSLRELQTAVKNHVLYKAQEAFEKSHDLVQKFFTTLIWRNDVYTFLKLDVQYEGKKHNLLADAGLVVLQAIMTSHTPSEIIPMEITWGKRERFVKDAPLARVFSRQREQYPVRVVWYNRNKSMCIVTPALKNTKHGVAPVTAEDLRREPAGSRNPYATYSILLLRQNTLVDTRKPLKDLDDMCAKQEYNTALQAYTTLRAQSKLETSQKELACIQKFKVDGATTLDRLVEKATEIAGLTASPATLTKLQQAKVVFKEKKKAVKGDMTAHKHDQKLANLHAILKRRQALQSEFLKPGKGKPPDVSSETLGKLVGMQRAIQHLQKKIQHIAAKDAAAFPPDPSPERPQTLFHRVKGAAQYAGQTLAGLVRPSPFPAHFEESVRTSATARRKDQVDKNVMSRQMAECTFEAIALTKNITEAIAFACGRQEATTWMTSAVAALHDARYVNDLQDMAKPKVFATLYDASNPRKGKGAALEALWGKVAVSNTPFDQDEFFEPHYTPGKNITAFAFVASAMEAPATVDTWNLLDALVHEVDAHFDTRGTFPANVSFASFLPMIDEASCMGCVCWVDHLAVNEAQDAEEGPDADTLKPKYFMVQPTVDDIEVDDLSDPRHFVTLMNETLYYLYSDHNFDDAVPEQTKTDMEKIRVQCKTKGRELLQELYHFAAIPPKLPEERQRPKVTQLKPYAYHLSASDEQPAGPDRLSADLRHLIEQNAHVRQEVRGAYRLADDDDRDDLDDLDRLEAAAAAQQDVEKLHGMARRVMHLARTLDGCRKLAHYSAAAMAFWVMMRNIVQAVPNSFPLLCQAAHKFRAVAFDTQFEAKSKIIQVTYTYSLAVSTEGQLVKLRHTGNQGDIYMELQVSKSETLRRIAPGNIKLLTYTASDKSEYLSTAAKATGARPVLLANISPEAVAAVKRSIGEGTADISIYSLPSALLHCVNSSDDFLPTSWLDAMLVAGQQLIDSSSILWLVHRHSFAFVYGSLLLIDYMDVKRLPGTVTERILEGARKERSAIPELLHRLVTPPHLGLPAGTSGTPIPRTFWEEVLLHFPPEKFHRVQDTVLQSTDFTSPKDFYLAMVQFQIASAFAMLLMDWLRELDDGMYDAVRPKFASRMKETLEVCVTTMVRTMTPSIVHVIPNIALAVDPLARGDE